MTTTNSIAYAQSMDRALDLWVKACEVANVAASPNEFDRAIKGFTVLHDAFASWHVVGLQGRHQQSFLTLIMDSILWVEAKRNNGDIVATHHDMEEARRGVRAEALRLEDDELRRHKAAAE